MRDEPGNTPARIALLDRILADSHRFVHAAMSLEAGLPASPPVPPRDAFRVFSNQVDVTLYYLAAGLRGSELSTSDFPDLREAHNTLLESSDGGVQRYEFVNMESDRIVNSLNTLTGEILPFVTARSGNAVVEL
jgi:hypothetical protein